jgi:hypothetical protein
MKGINKAVTLYLTQTVYRFYHETLTAKDLCLVLYPATRNELEKIGNVDRSEVMHIQTRMPRWWSKWYYQLSLQDKFKFAKIIEQRLKEYKLI